MYRTLPSYADRLDALHRALADGFRQLVDYLPLAGHEIALDAGCGDGFFTNLLASRLPAGQVIALDTSPDFLHELAARFERSTAEGRIRLRQGDVAAIDCPAATFDLVWSAHSMQSYPAIAAVLAEFHRVLRPGGLLAILESDNLHALVLNWPPELELAALQAEHAHFAGGDNRRGAYFPRFADKLLREAGFADVTRHYLFIHRHRPAGEAAERYVALYLNDLLDRIGHQLDPPLRALAEELASPQSDKFLPRQENFYFGSLQMLFLARALPRLEA